MPDAGRPTKLTPRIQEKICQALLLGNYRKQAAHYAGIDDATLRRWLDRGRTEPDGAYGELRRAVRDAESRAHVAAMGCITKAIRDGDWKAAAWTLERKLPEQYAPRSRLFDPYRVLEILEEEGLVVDRDRALQALAAAEPGLPGPADADEDLDAMEVSEEDRRALFRVLHAAKRREGPRPIPSVEVAAE